MATKVIKMNPQQWEKWLGELGPRFKPAMERGIAAGAQRCIPILQDATRMAKPASSRGSIGAFDTGLYLASWQTSPIAMGTRVFNPRFYSGTIESGRRPSPVSREGIRNLEGWAKRKLNLSNAEARNAAWAIAQTLKERRLEPRKVMLDSENKMIKAVEQEIEHELDLELGR